MFCIFPEAFSQVTIMPKWQLPMMFYFQSGNFQKVRLGPLRRCRLQCGRVLRLGWARGPSTVDRTGWGRASLLGYTWEEVAWDIAAVGKLPLGKIPLESCNLGTNHLGKFLHRFLFSLNSFVKTLHMQKCSLRERTVMSSNP